MNNGRYSASVDQLSQHLLRSAPRRRDQPSTRSPALGTGIWPSRDIIAVRRHVAGLCPSLATAPPAMARTSAGNARVFDLGRPTPVRDGRSAGGRWIRTLGPRIAMTGIFGWAT